VEREPERADYQRDLSVSYNKMGDLARVMGNGEAARRFFEESLQVRQRLVEREPERADYQRDLSVSYNKMGGLARAMGDGEDARRFFEQSLQVIQRLVEREPERADYQMDLVSYLVRFGTAPYLKRALDIVLELKRTNRLPKVDEWKIADLRSKLEQAESEGV
jgi:tetratricopeptide (TPR) repeat protein